MATIHIGIEVIVPQRRINVAGYQEMFNHALIREGNQMLDLFEQSAKTFKKKDEPSFTKTKPQIFAYDLEVKAGALRFGKANAVYSALNFGYERTVVLPKGRRPMRYQKGYRPATSPSRPLNPSVATAYGEEWGRSRYIEQKVAARGFDKAVARKRRGYFVKLVKGRTKKVPFWV